MRGIRSRGWIISFSFVFLAIIAASAALDLLPLAILFAYAIVSTVTFIAYAIDKQAAINDRWRIKESSLQLMALCCGWPGALIGQQTLRHKSQKRAFGIVLWLCIVINIIALAGFGYYNHTGTPFPQSISAIY